MKLLFTVFLVTACHAFALAQTDFSGAWQGVLIQDGTTIEKGTLIYADFTISDAEITGRTRTEVYNSKFFAVKKIKGSIKSNALTFTEFVIEKKSQTTKTSWCNISSTLSYNDSTGYLSGTYTSSDCRRNSGKIILYRIKNVSLSATENSPMSHSWFKSFSKNYTKGYPAPEIQERNRSNFVFEPIYFDYDKAEIRTEHYAFLKSMILIIDSHSDLRIKVTGHTDGDGSDAYNLDLSKRRAEALVQFFVANGLSKDKIVLDFKGEKEPIDSNKTANGKQLNRRVDFSFI
ncbi:MAG: OmpA family protein [Bacteroidota bacterium]